MSCVMVLKLYDTDPYVFRKYEHTVRYRDQDTWRVRWVAGSVFAPIRTFSEAWKIRFRTRHWYAAYQGHDIYFFSQICRKYRRTTYTSCNSTNALNAIWFLIEPNLHDASLYSYILPNEIPRYDTYHAWNSMVHRVSRVKFHGTLSFIVNFHAWISTAHRVSRVKLHDTLR